MSSRSNFFAEPPRFQQPGQAVHQGPKCGAAMHEALEAPSSAGTLNHWDQSATSPPETGRQNSSFPAGKMVEIGNPTCRKTGIVFYPFAICLSTPLASPTLPKPSLRDAGGFDLRAPTHAHQNTNKKTSIHTLSPPHHMAKNSKSSAPNLSVSSLPFQSIAEARQAEAWSQPLPPEKAPADPCGSKKRRSLPHPTAEAIGGLRLDTTSGCWFCSFQWSDQATGKYWQHMLWQYMLFTHYLEMWFKDDLKNNYVCLTLTSADTSAV